MAKRYPVFAVTVDVVILTVVDGVLNVVLVERRGDPYAGSWAVPGGFKKPEESLDDAAARELREETGIEAPERLEQFGAYGDPGRDPRGNVVSIAFLAVGPDVPELIAGSDAADARLWPVADVVDGTPPPRVRPPAHRHRRRRPRVPPPAGQRSRHRVRRAGVHADAAAQRVRSRVGRATRLGQLPAQPRPRLDDRLRRAIRPGRRTRPGRRPAARAVPSDRELDDRLPRQASAAKATEVSDRAFRQRVLGRRHRLGRRRRARCPVRVRAGGPVLADVPVAGVRWHRRDGRRRRLRVGAGRVHRRHADGDPAGRVRAGERRRRRRRPVRALPRVGRRRQRCRDPDPIGAVIEVAVGPGRSRSLPAQPRTVEQATGR